MCLIPNKHDIGGTPPRTRRAVGGSRLEMFAQIVSNIAVRVGRNNLMLVAAGVAFYEMIAVFPAVAAFASIYGLFADPHGIERQISEYSGIFPADSLKLLTGALEIFARKSSSTLNTALLLSLSIALWSAKAGISSLMTGLNIANEANEGRGLIAQQSTALALTFARHHIRHRRHFSHCIVADRDRLSALVWRDQIGPGTRTLAVAGPSHISRAGRCLQIWAVQSQRKVEVDHLGRGDGRALVVARIGRIFVICVAVLVL